MSQGPIPVPPDDVELLEVPELAALLEEALRVLLVPLVELLEVVLWNSMDPAAVGLVVCGVQVMVLPATQ
jgi:hypothetical protein